MSDFKACYVKFQVFKPSSMLNYGFFKLQKALNNYAIQNLEGHKFISCIAISCLPLLHSIYNRLLFPISCEIN